MKITPTPLTAALAGFFSGLVLPFIWSRFGDTGSSGIELGLAFLVAVALPAHAFVMGFGRSETASSRTLDTALLKRVGAWLAAAAATVVVSTLLKAQ